MSVPDVFGSTTGRELARLLYEACPDAVVVIDDEGTLLFANPAVEALFGYTPDQIVGQRLAVLQPERLREAHKRGLARYMATGEPRLDWQATQTFGLHRDGHEFPVEIAFTAVAPRRFGGFIRDISKRVETERALAASEATHRELLQNANDIVYTHDLEGNFTYANAAAARTYGWSEDELMRMNLRDLVDPEHLETARAKIVEDLWAHDDATSPPYPILTHDRDGRDIWVEISTRLVRDDAGGAAGVHGIARDITGRRVAEAQLAQEREFRERVMDASTNAIAVFDRDGLLRLVNKRICEMTGYAEHELLGQRFHQLVRPGSTSLMPDALQQALEGEFVDRLEFGGLRKDGSAFRARATLRPLMEGDQIVGVVGTAEDITEERQRADALTRTQELRDRVLEASTNAIGACDMEGRITLVNKRLCEMTGYTEEELLGNHMAIVLRPESTVGVPPMFERVFAGESLDDIEFEALRKDGTRFVARAALRPLMEGDRIVGLIGTAEEITDRKRADDLLAAQRRLLEMIAVGAPLQDVLTEIAETVEHQVVAICSILLLDADGKHLRPGAAPSLPDEYVALTDGLEIGPSVGTCGTAAYLQQVVISEDIASDPLWDGVHDVMAGFGLAASWSTPIFSSSGAILGTFAMYYRERHSPTEQEKQIIDVFSHVAGIAIERRWAETQSEKQRNLLAEKSALLEAALAAERERARRDPLTGSLNHAVIADEVRRLIDDPQTHSFVLAMVDVDGLKAVNDTYGHQMGDQVLLAVAASLRVEGATVGRYGGDEFVAILPDADREAAAAYRQRVTDALAAVELRDTETGSRIQIDASIGLAIYPEEGEAVEDLIKLSDSAMYASRRQRADLSATTAFARIHGGDRAAELVGEIVPFLTSPGNLQEKLNLVASRVSAGAGYDGVNFSLYGNTGPSARTASFSPDSSEAAAQYDESALPEEEPGPMRLLLEATRRPVIIDDIATTEFATDDQKRILASVGLLSAMVVPMIWRGVLVGSLSVASKRPAAFGPRDAQFLVAIATQVTSIVRTAALVDDLQAASDRLLQAQTETVLMLAAAAEAHDDTTGRHLVRVRGIAQALALELGHGEEKAKEIGLAAVLHDIGKIRVPDYVLASSASLSDTEWALMKEHTVWGSEFLGSRGGFELAMEVARSHHERWDGSGYPDGLAGASIPEAAAITSVADSLDAMISDRPYRPGRPLDDAISEIEAWSGRQFSPKVVTALLALYERGELAYLTDDAVALKPAA